MVEIKDLRRINLLRNIPVHLLEIIASEAKLSIFGVGTVLMRSKQRSDNLYMLVMGQVALKQKLTADIDVILSLIQAGASFGTSALIANQTASYTAECQEPCEVISLSGERMIQLFEQNHELGFYMLRGAAIQYKKNMDRRARMIMKVLDDNPDLKDSIDDMEELTLMI